MMAISANNKFIYAWGNNLYGQLGIFKYYNATIWKIFK